MTAIGGHARAYKSADQDLQNSAVLQDDNALSFAVGSGEKWWFKILGFVTTDDLTPDIQLAMNGPATNNIRFHIHISEHTGAVGSIEAIKTAWNDALGLNYNAAANDDFLLEGTFETSAAGTVVLRWAQRVSDASFTHVLRGSSLIATRLE